MPKANTHHRRQATGSRGAGNSNLLWFGGTALLVIGILVAILLGTRRDPGANAPPPAVDVAESSQHSEDAVALLGNLPVPNPKEMDHEVATLIMDGMKAVRRAPKSDETWGVLGTIYLAHEFKQEAAICFERAAQIDPKDARWPYLNARSLLLTEPHNAVPYLEQAIAVCGNKPPAPRLTLCETLLQLGELDAAEKQLLIFLADNSRDPRARLIEARLMVMQERYADALAQLQQLRKLVAENRQGPILQLMAECLRRLNRIDEAGKAQSMAERLGEPAWDDPYMREVFKQKKGLKTRLNEADLLYGSGAFDKSIALLEETIVKYPESEWAKIFLARALIRTGSPDSERADQGDRLERAVKLLEEALALDPHSVEAMFRLGVAKGYQGNLAEAATLYQRAIDEKPDFTMAHYNLANARHRMGDREAALQSLRATVSVQPDFAEGQLQLGILLLQSGRYMEAEKHLDIASRLRPQDATIRNLLGKARRQLPN